MYELIQASAHHLPMLADKSIHAIVTSPLLFGHIRSGAEVDRRSVDADFVQLHHLLPQSLTPSNQYNMERRYMQMAEMFQLINASAHHLPMIADGSVHAIVTSPPY
jgi:tRNA G10  N-methylase Trm11